MDTYHIAPPDASAAEAAKAHWDSIAKPLNGLGVLEDLIVKIAALNGNAQVKLNKRGVLVFCADNGVVAQGVTQTDASVTAVMAEKIAKGQSSVCAMAKAAGATVDAFDVGVARRVTGPRDFHIADGTRDMTQGPAMTRDQAQRAVNIGISLAGEYKKKGYDILVTGEMGIGNTTTSAAMAAVLLDMAPTAVTGRGAGLSDDGLERKIRAVERAIRVNRPNRGDALDVLSKVGGLDIAAMTGLFLGGAVYRIPVVIDGLISSVAALTAALLAPGCTCAMLASHCSAEPIAKEVLRRLGLPAVIDAGLKLGEGTGGVCLLPLLDMALAVYGESTSFAETGIRQYTPQGEKPC